MRQEVKNEIDQIASKIITEGSVSVSSDHNNAQRSLRVALDFNGVKREEADKVEEEVRNKYPGATVYAFYN